jgi:hypothetical protein
MKEMNDCLPFSLLRDVTFHLRFPSFQDKEFVRERRRKMKSIPSESSIKEVYRVGFSVGIHRDFLLNRIESQCRQVQDRFQGVE